MTDRTPEEEVLRPDQQMARYLTLSYRRTVLGQNVRPDSVLTDDVQFVAALKAELARINRLGLGANLASRDFASYQHKRALEAALAELETRQNAPS
jgi:hypothetical protein